MSEDTRTRDVHRAAIDLRTQFVADARAPRDGAMASDRGSPAGDVHAYLRARVRGIRTVRPAAKSWRT